MIPFKSGGVSHYTLDNLDTELDEAEPIVRASRAAAVFLQERHPVAVPYENCSVLQHVIAYEGDDPFHQALKQRLIRAATPLNLSSKTENGSLSQKTRHIQKKSQPPQAGAIAGNDKNLPGYYGALIAPFPPPVASVLYWRHSAPEFR